MEIDIAEFMQKVAEQETSLDMVAKKAFEDLIYSFQLEGRLKNGHLDLSDMDSDERDEFIRLAEQFDKDFYDRLLQTLY